MRPLLTLTVLLFSLLTQALASCEDLKADIAKKLDAKGVKNYTLDIVTADKASDGDGKVVGSCEADTKKIVYHREAAAAPAKDAAKDQEKK